MLRSADVTGWLTAQGLGFPVADNREMPAMPDELVAIWLAGGGPTLGERTFDQQQLTVASRGRQASVQSAELVAEHVDDLLLGAVGPVMMGARRVIAIDRLGGPPAVIDVDAGQRSILTCSYLLRVARTVF